MRSSALITAQRRGWFRRWTLVLHIWGRHCIGFKVQPCSGSVFAACLLTPLSLGTVLTEPQDDPLGPRCSSASGVAPLRPQSRRPSVRGARSRSRPSSRRPPGRRWGGRLGTELDQGGLWVSRHLLWLSPGADGRPWRSVSTPLPLRWVSSDDKSPLSGFLMSICVFWQM